MKKFWFPIAPAKEVGEEPFGESLLNTPLVLFRHGGNVYALFDQCPHRGAPLSKGKIEGGCLICPYHGWKFDPKGSCTSIPGLINLSPKKAHHVASFKAEERYGLIWVNLSQDSEERIPELPLNLEDKQFSLAFDIASPMKEVLENGLDPLHTHLVHAGWIRTDAQRQKIDVAMKIGEQFIEAEYLNEAKQRGWIHRILSFRRQVERSFGRYFHPAIFQIEFLTNRGEYLQIYGFCSPKSDGSTQLFLHTLTNAQIPTPILKFILIPLFKVAIKQDKKILEVVQQRRPTTQTGLREWERGL